METAHKFTPNPVNHMEPLWMATKAGQGNEAASSTHPREHLRRLLEIVVQVVGNPWARSSAVRRRSRDEPMILASSSCALEI